MDDPILRCWLVGRALGRFPGEPPFTAHHPPYLSDALPLAAIDLAQSGRAAQGGAGGLGDAAAHGQGALEI